MGAPSINIAFIEKSSSVIQRGERGIVALLLKEDTVKQESFIVYSVADIPDWLSEDNCEQLEMALKGYQNAPRKVIVYVIESSSEKLASNYTKAYGNLEKLKWNYLAVPSAQEDEQTELIASWIKTQRTQNKKTFKAVLPNTPGDNEGIINVANGCSSGNKNYTAAQMCARVAGIICGTPITIACTFAPLPEMTDCEKLSKEEINTSVDGGKFVFVWDGEKVKVCRGVTSFVTTTDNKGDAFKSIKIVDAMDMMYDDITITIEDNYTGKYPNNYDNKCILITAINGYFSGLVRENVLASGNCEIDLDAQRTYFMEKGGNLVVNGEMKKIEECSDDEIKQANTGKWVFLKAAVSINDAMEDFDLAIYIG